MSADKPNSSDESIDVRTPCGESDDPLPLRRLGTAKGQVNLSDDFDEPLVDFDDYQ